MTNRIKVAQIITRMDWGGSPDIVRVLCAQLDSQCYDTTLVYGLTRYPSEKTKRFLRDFTGSTHCLPCLRRDINLWFDLKAFFQLYRLFRHEKFDIVHTHTAKAGALARLAAFFARTPVIIHTPHGHNFYGYFGRAASRAIVWVERFLSLFTNRIIALTTLERNDLVAEGVGSVEKIRVIYHGFEFDSSDVSQSSRVSLKHALGIALDVPVVGMVARLEPVKGVHIFIETAHLMTGEFPQALFLIVGEGSMAQFLKAKVDEFNLGERVIFAGWREDVLAIMRIMDVLVLSSLNEAVGMVLIEAQSVGVAVVATNVGGIPEIVQSEVTGLLVPANDALSLAQAIKRLLRDKEKRIELGKAGMAFARGRFQAEVMVREISGLYQELMSSAHH